MEGKGKYVLNSSTEGKIEKMLIILKRNELGDAICEIIVDLIGKMEGVEFVVLELVRPDEICRNYKTTLETAEKGSRTSLDYRTLFCDETLSSNNWIRDPFLVTYSADGHRKLMRPRHSHTENKDRFLGMGGLISENLMGFDFEESSLVFEGGNILKSKDFCLVGGDSIFINTAEQEVEQSLSDIGNEFGETNIVPVMMEELSREYLRRMKESGLKYFPELSGEFVDRYIYPIGAQENLSDGDHSLYDWVGLRQPFIHVDLFVTLGGVVDGKTIIFVGKPSSGINRDGLENKEFPAGAQMKFARNGVCLCVKTMKKRLDELEIKYKIIYLPLPLTYYESRTLDDKVKYDWCFLSYNNCLIEIYDDKKVVWLPSYADEKRAYNYKILKETDEKAKKIYEENGFEVNIVKGDFQQLCINGGSLHCMTNDIVRI